MNDLDTLRPEVQEAINRTDITVEMFDTLVTVNRDDYDIIRAELLRLADENAQLRDVLADRDMDREMADSEHAEIQAKYGIAQAAEPVRQFRVVPKGSVWTDVKDPEIWASVVAHPESYETRVLYTHPQPAQGAKDAIIRFGCGEVLSHEEMCEIVNQAVCAGRELAALKARMKPCAQVVGGEVRALMDPEDEGKYVAVMVVEE